MKPADARKPGKIKPLSEKELLKIEIAKELGIWEQVQAEVGEL